MSNALAAFTPEGPNLRCSWERNCLSPCLQGVLTKLMTQISERILPCSRHTACLVPVMGDWLSIITSQEESTWEKMSLIDSWHVSWSTGQCLPRSSSRPVVSLHREQHTHTVAFRCLCSRVLKQISLFLGLSRFLRYYFWNSSDHLKCYSSLCQNSSVSPPKNH